jgi:hypothetical protein
VVRAERGIAEDVVIIVVAVAVVIAVEVEVEDIGVDGNT